MEALDSGVAAVQQYEGKLHLCAYFSHHLFPKEWNYDVGDRLLLAVKLALEEYQHWLYRLDGLQESCLQTPKWLNAWQARWTLKNGNE